MTSSVSMTRCKPTKNGQFSDGGPTASLMIKLAKIWREREREKEREREREREKIIGAVGITYLPLMGDLPDL